MYQIVQLGTVSKSADRLPVRSLDVKQDAITSFLSCDKQGTLIPMLH